MALVLRDRVKETTATAGTGTYTLAGAVTGFETFNSVGNGNTTYYGCSDGVDFEVGIGTYTASGTTLARTTILQSSNSDSAVNWGSGTRTIFCTLPAEKMSFLDASGNVVAANGSALTALNASNLGSGTVANARLDAQLQDVAGLAVTNGGFIVGDGSNFVLETEGTARASLGLGTSAVLDTGISNTNVPKFTSGVADDDFLRVAGTAVEGRSASEVLSDIGAITASSSDTLTNKSIASSQLTGALPAISGAALTNLPGGADLYAANESSPAAQPSATGANAIAVGDSAVASGANAVALGSSRAAGQYSFAAGIYSNSTSYGARGNFCYAIGYKAGTGTSEQGSVAIGWESVSTGNKAVALGTSYASGANSFAAAIDNGTSTYGPTAANSIAMGKKAKASGSKSVAISGENAAASGAGSFAAGGEYPTASGAYSVAIGGSVNTASGEASYAFGKRALAAQVGKYAYGAFLTSTAGATQGGMIVLNAATTDATATVLSSDANAAGSANQLVAASDTCIMFSGTVVAMQNGAQDQGGWEIKGLLKNDGGTTTLVNSNIQTFADGNGWVVALTADNTNNALAVTCTGEASHNIRWCANISTSEVTYA
tara:strand:- start:1272 stop:3083 length:1812 start_codon:yes stop_codon:yes gene_type:complete